MITLEIGRLYVCPEYHVLGFPTEKAASSMGSTTASIAPLLSAARWSEKLGCHVFWIPAGTPWIITANIAGFDKNYDYRQVQVLTVDGKLGWINVTDWMNIEELAQ